MKNLICRLSPINSYKSALFVYQEKAETGHDQERGAASRTEWSFGGVFDKAAGYLKGGSGKLDDAGKLNQGQPEKKEKTPEERVARAEFVLELAMSYAAGRLDVVEARDPKIASRIEGFKLAMYSDDLKGNPIMPTTDRFLSVVKSSIEKAEASGADKDAIAVLNDRYNSLDVGAMRRRDVHYAFNKLWAATGLAEGDNARFTEKQLLSMTTVAMELAERAGVDPAQYKQHIDRAMKLVDEGKLKPY